MTHRTIVALCCLALSASRAAPASTGPFPLDNYLKITDVAWESASPDGTRIAYTSEESGSWQVWVAGIDGSGRRQLTHAKDAADSAWWIPGEPHTILYGKSKGGSGIDQLYYIRDDRPGSVPLFPRESSVTHVFGAFSPDGSKLAFSSDRRKPGDFDVYVLNRSTGSVRRVYTVDGTAYAAAWSADAKELLVRHVLTPYNDNLYALDLRTGAARLLTPHGGDANFESAQFAPHSHSVLCISDLHAQYHTIQRIELGSRRMTPLINPRNDIDQVVVSGDGRHMAYIINRDGFGEVVVADASTGRTMGSPSMPPYIAEQAMFINGGRTLLYDAEGPAFPKVPWTYDLRTHKTARILEPDFHGISPDSIVEPQVVHVRSFDGTMVPAWYFHPKSSGKVPAVLDIHGGPELQDRAWFYPFAQYLASRGYALLDPNIRGSTGYGRRYLHMADGRKRENAVKDVAALRNWLVAAGGADPKAVFVNGASYGGYVVLSALYHYPDAWAGGIDVYGVADWVSFLEKTGENRANREAVYGSLSRDRQFLASISPINHVNRIKRPVLIIGGANDTIVPIAQSKHLAGALRHDNVPVQLHIFSNEGHGISHLDNLKAIYQWSFSFMQRYADR